MNGNRVDVDCGVVSKIGTPSLFHDRRIRDTVQRKN